MAGVTDRPFRQLCKRLGAGYAVSEMVTSRTRAVEQPEDHRAAPTTTAKPAPIAVQIAGTDAAMMAEAARLQHRPRRADHRHQHGLPGQEGVQQVGRLGADAGRAAGARDRRGGGRRLRAARRAGDAEDAHRLVRQRDATRCALARAAESAGVAMVTVHGRTREQGYKGDAEYDTIAAVKAAVRDPGGRQRRHRLAARRRARCSRAPAPTR